MENKDIEIRNLELKLHQAFYLLNRSIPYINQHYERSVFGDEAKKLINQIQEFKDSIQRK